MQIQVLIDLAEKVVPTEIFVAARDLVVEGVVGAADMTGDVARVVAVAWAGWPESLGRKR